MHHARHPLRTQTQDHGCQIGDKCRAGPSVVHHPDRHTGLQAVDHPAHHAGKVSGLQPRGAHHGRTRARCHLPRQLGSPVGVHRVGRVVLAVGGGGLTVEHVVSRHVNEVGSHLVAGLGQEPDGIGVHRLRPLRIQLAAVHVGPGGAVHDHVGPQPGHSLVDSSAVGHIQVRADQAGHHSRAGNPHHLPAQLTGGTGNEDLHAPLSHQPGLSRYQATVSARPSSKPRCGSQPRASMRPVSTE